MCPGLHVVSLKDARVPSLKRGEVAKWQSSKDKNNHDLIFLQQHQEDNTMCRCTHETVQIDPCFLNPRFTMLE
jgi:hypothetical protein